MPHSPEPGRRAGVFGLSFSERVDLLVRVLLSAAVLFGCWLIVEPFMTAILISAILAVVTWPVFTKVLAWTRNAATPAALLMVAGLIVTVLIPLTFLMLSLTQQLPKAVRLVTGWVKDPTPILASVESLPYVGPWLHEQITFAVDPKAFAGTVEQLIEPVSRWVLNTAVNVSNGLMQMCLVLFIVFFFYRDGIAFARRFHELLLRVSGHIASDITEILTNTTRSVVFGIIGTAIVQGAVCGIGLWIAGVPGVLILSVAACILSVIPIGPPVIWIPAAVWLYGIGETGMAVFLCAWGVLVVATVDNLVKPLLIARGSTLPMSLIFLGVFGGVIAFGFLGLILGPLFLAIGSALFEAWLKNSALGRGAESALRAVRAPVALHTEGAKHEEHEETAGAQAPDGEEAGKPDAATLQDGNAQRTDDAGSK